MPTTLHYKLEVTLVLTTETQQKGTIDNLMDIFLMYKYTDTVIYNLHYRIVNILNKLTDLSP